MISRFTYAAAVAAATLLVAPTAQAHVGLEYQVAPAASKYKASFKLAHGCGTSPTRQVVVVIPAGVSGARPMPKPGWTLDIVRGKRQPGDAADEVLRISWTARTPADMLASEHYDEFVLTAKLPPQPGPIYWPVSQLCEAGRHDWAEIPRAGQDPRELKSPAPLLDILPSGGAAGHVH